jgi:GTP-binding protein EngB required for normal cell division
MGNKNGINSENSYYMSLNFIGESMENLLTAISGLNYSSKSSARSQKISIYDFWDYFYTPEFNFISQVKEIEEKFNIMKDDLILDFSECLIIHIKDLNSPKIDIILDKMDKLNRGQYIPPILFLSDNFDENDKNFINLKFKVYKNIISRYKNIDKRMIFFEKYIDENNEEKLKKIKNILLRFCSYYNELGDRFSIGEGDKEICYDLTEENFPFTVNIACIGRFGKGKSTGTNFLLGEKRAKENKSGTSVTSKINFYHVPHFPIKVYDIPGFENEKTIINAVEQFQILNKEINKLRDQLHIILYFIKSTDERMFTEMEYKIFKQICQIEDIRIIYILTYSSPKTDHKELIDMINTGIKSVTENAFNKKKLNDSEKFTIIKKLKASEGNTVLVNFYSTAKNDVYGISDFFDTIGDHVEASKVYQKFQSNCYLTKDEFNERIKEEAEIRRLKAKDVLFKHRIGGGLIGMIPLIDWALQKYVIQKDAAKKAGAIFGFDITIYEKTQVIQIDKKDNNDSSEENIKKLMSEPKVVLNINKNEKSDNLLDNEDIKDEDNFDLNEYDLEQNKEKKKKSYTKKYGRYAVSAFTGSVSFTTNAANFLTTTASMTLIAVNIAFSFIGSAVGFGMGSYLTYQHCESLLDKFVELFIQNAKSLSNSLELGLKYFRKMAYIYRKKKS